MSILESLITNRTAEDVARWKALRDKGFDAMTADEKAEWLAGMRGAYNASDLNRVGEAMYYIADRLRSCGWDIEVRPRTDWALTDLGDYAEIQRYLHNLQKLWNAMDLFVTTPEVPTGAKPFNAQEANDIERILLDIDDMLQRTEAAYLFSGDVFAGEV